MSDTTSTQYPNSPNSSGSTESSWSVVTSNDNNAGRDQIRIEPIQHGANQHAQELNEESEAGIDSDCEAGSQPEADCSRGVFHCEQMVPEQQKTRKRISSKESAKCKAMADAYDELPEHLRKHFKAIIKDRDDKRRKVEKDRLKLQMENLSVSQRADTGEPSSDD